MKRKFLTYALASTMTLSSIVPTIASQQTVSNNDSNVETLIGFKYPENIISLKNKNLTATLTGENTNIQLSLNELLDNNTITKDNYKISSQVTKDGERVISILFKVEGLKPQKALNLTVDGDKYTKTSVELNTTEYSKRVNINTEITVKLGDVNNDNIIDENDLKILENNLNSNDTTLDLNGDGVVTVSDIAIVNKNMGTDFKATTLDTEAVPSALIKKVNPIADQSFTVPEGTEVNDIFKPNSEVKLQATDPTKNVEVPLVFKNPEPISSFSMVLPEGSKLEDTTITFFDENDQEISLPKSATKYDTDGFFRTRNAQNVVTINLGQRVPVKRIKVSVKPSADGFVTIKDVKISKDVIDNNVTENTKVKNIRFTEGDSQVELIWDAVPNVRGYKVYYGTDKADLSKTAIAGKTNIIIENLENLKPYYFQVVATSENWEGTRSDIISATPAPKTKPAKPDFLRGNPADSSIELSWGKSKNAEWYNVYAQKEDETAPTKVATNIKPEIIDAKNISYTLRNLENDIKYTVWVTAENNLGESEKSDPTEATPKEDKIVPPTLPEIDRIPNSNIESVTMPNPDYYDKTMYPNGMDPNWLIDNDYTTSWVHRSYWEDTGFTFTFKEAKDMDYLIWVPRLDKAFRKAGKTYTITVWGENDDLNGKGTIVANSNMINHKGEDNSYYVLTFPKQTGVKKIKVGLGEVEGNGHRVNASEVVFYEYNNISDRVEALFSNPTRTAIKPTVTADEIAKLETEINDIKGFILNKDILLEQIDIAKGLLNNDTSVLGIVKNGVLSISSAKDIKAFNKSVNNWQPLGIIASAGGYWSNPDKINIYAEIPEGEKVSIIFTQYYDQADVLSAPPIVLKNGLNQITTPKIGSGNDRGGSVYLAYEGEKQDQIKLHIKGGLKAPYLELIDFNSISETESKQRIKDFILFTEDYIPKNTVGNKKINHTNTLDISMPNVILSLPATQILAGIKSNGADTIEKQVDKVYDTVLAWKDLIDVLYKTYGIDNPTDFQTRQNVRYKKMFAGAFMYAAGNHIGIEWDSVPELMNGTPISKLTADATSNNLFGWGIAHEIGHVMDALGTAEVTNNIYSIMGQTFDGKSNTLLSRLEVNDVYKSIYEKVSVGNEGLPNNPFVQLGMYWQLHLAYDNADNPTKFYNELHKLYRSGTIDKFDKTDANPTYEKLDKFAVASSKIANKNLTEYFTRYGAKLSEAAKTEMATLPKEDRAIWYLNDESRRLRLKGQLGSSNIDITGNVTNTVNENKDQVVTISITPTGNADDILGYEILRNGKKVGFTTTSTYEDIIDSANNTSFEYSATPIDKLGNMSPTKTLGEVRISYDDVIDTSKYTVSSTGEVVFTEPFIVSGIRITPKDKATDALPTTGTFKVQAEITYNKQTTDGSVATPITEMVIAKNGDFTKNLAGSTEKYVTYFNQPNQPDTDKMWSYQTTKIQLTGIDLTKYNVEFIQYPGDDVAFMETSVGILSHEYAGVPAGSVVIMGTYRGNTVTNEILLKGRFDENGADKVGTTGPQTFVERAINGEMIMFDTLNDDGKITAPTAEGIFMFVVDTVAEGNIQNNPHPTSTLPVQIKVEMTKKDSNGERPTSDTLWVNMPSYDSLPKIILNGGQ